MFLIWKNNLRAQKNQKIVVTTKKFHVLTVLHKKFEIFMFFVKKCLKSFYGRYALKHASHKSFLDIFWQKTWTFRIFYWEQSVHEIFCSYYNFLIFFCARKMFFQIKNISYLQPCESKSGAWINSPWWVKRWKSRLHLETFFSQIVRHELLLPF